MCDSRAAGQGGRNCSKRWGMAHSSAGGYLPSLQEKALNVSPTNQKTKENRGWGWLDSSAG